MAKERIRRPAAAPDPVEESNRKILADRQARIEAQRKAIPDLGLQLKDPEPEPATAAEFMDQFDKRAFGYGAPTITKIVWGPDDLVDYSPSFREKLDQYGREDLAHMFEEAIRAKGAAAMPEPMMAKAMTVAINKFGREAVAAAFRDRVLRIPFRTVEIDASDELDPEVLGSGVLGETVKRYERPGMEYRFFSQGCVDRFGWRGYTPVREKGEIVCAGTLMLAEIRRDKAEARRLRQRQLAQEKLDGIADTYAAAAEQTLEEAARGGLNVSGISALDRGDVLTASHAGGEDAEGYLGRSRGANVEIGREEIG